MKLNKIVDQLLFTNSYLSVLYVSDNQIDLDKKQIRYPNFFQISYQTLENFISKPIGSDLLVIELSEETVLKLSIEEILEQIKFYEGVLIKTDTTYQLNYPIKYENSLSFRIKILGCINKNFIIKNCLKALTLGNLKVTIQSLQSKDSKRTSSAFQHHKGQQQQR